MRSAQWPRGRQHVFKKIILFVYNIEALNKIRTIIQEKNKNLRFPPEIQPLTKG
jgi:hypothetical protein